MIASSGSEFGREATIQLPFGLQRAQEGGRVACLVELLHRTNG